MENRVIDLATGWWHGRREATVSEQGDDKADSVPRNKRPSHAQVEALRAVTALRRRRGNKAWRALAVELSAYSGVRRGELAVLDDTTVHRDGRVRVLWRLETIGGPHLALPKAASLRDGLKFGQAYGSHTPRERARSSISLSEPLRPHRLPGAALPRVRGSLPRVGYCG